MELPTLYAVAATGKRKEWSISLEGNTIVMRHGYEGGKMQESRKHVECKNQGRANETTLHEQALKEARALWKKKVKKGYSKDGQVTGAVWAMLVQNFGKQSRHIHYPCFAQPKLDGLRAKYEAGEFRLRETFDFNFCHEELEGELARLAAPYPLDGELYSRELDFETTNGLLRKAKWTDADSERARQIKYFVFDWIDVESSFRARWEKLYALYHQRGPFKYIQLVWTDMLDDRAEVEKTLQTALGQGYEGIILRNLSGMYRAGYRSPDVQKYKLFYDEEFEIVNYRRAGSDTKPALVWICRNAEGDEFAVKHACTTEQTLEYLAAPIEDYRGRMLTVTYQELTKKGIPRFPVAKGIRN